MVPKGDRDCAEVRINKGFHTTCIQTIRYPGGLLKQPLVNSDKLKR